MTARLRRSRFPSILPGAFAGASSRITSSRCSATVLGRRVAHCVQCIERRVTEPLVIECPVTALHVDVHCIEDHVLVPREGDVLVARRRIERRVLAIEGRVLIIERRVLVGLHDGRAERPAGPRGGTRGADSVVRARDAAAVEARVASAIGATKQTPLPVSRERTLGGRDARCRL